MIHHPNSSGQKNKASQPTLSIEDSKAPIAPVAPIAPSAPGAPIDPMVPTFAPSSPTPVPKTIAPSGAGKTPVPAPALPTSDTKSKKDSKKKMSKIHKP